MTYPIEWYHLDEKDTRRFWSKVSTPDADGCMRWLGWKAHTSGYGKFGAYRGGDWKKLLAHRVAAVYALGAFDPKLHVDHICHHPSCVNPSHLRLATNKQNGENLKGANRNSKSGVRGVSWSTTAKAWWGAVKHEGRLHNAGYFADIHEAEAAVIALRLELFTHSDMAIRTACHRCTPGATGPMCSACAGEVATALRDPEDELTAVYYPAHSPALDTYRADVRFGGIA